VSERRQSLRDAFPPLRRERTSIGRSTNPHWRSVRGVFFLLRRPCDEEVPAMRRGSRSPLLTAPRASLGRDMLRRIASNLGGVAARSGRGAFGAVPAVHAQQRSAGGLMVVRLPLLGCPSRAVGERGSGGAAPRTPRRGRSRRGVIAATRRARSRPGGNQTHPPRDRVARKPSPHFVIIASRSTRSRDASLGWLERERERARRKNVFFRQRKTFEKRAAR
jgi:hypothetical protein